MIAIGAGSQIKDGHDAMPPKLATRMEQHIEIGVKCVRMAEASAISLDSCQTSSTKHAWDEFMVVICAESHLTRGSEFENAKRRKRTAC